MIAANRKKNHKIGAGDGFFSFPAWRANCKKSRGKLFPPSGLISLGRKSNNCPVE